MSKRETNSLQRGFGLGENKTDQDTHVGCVKFNVSVNACPCSQSARFKRDTIKLKLTQVTFALTTKSVPQQILNSIKLYTLAIMKPYTSDSVLLKNC